MHEVTERKKQLDADPDDLQQLDQSAKSWEEFKEVQQ